MHAVSVRELKILTLLQFHSCHVHQLKIRQYMSCQSVRYNCPYPQEQMNPVLDREQSSRDEMLLKHKQCWRFNNRVAVK